MKKYLRITPLTKKLYPKYIKNLSKTNTSYILKWLKPNKQTNKTTHRNIFQP